MSLITQGILKKMQSQHLDPIQYKLTLNNEEWILNDWLGKVITLKFSGDIHCLGCGTVVKKSYQAGYCFPCTQKLAACDICIVRPEKCHYGKGTCREPAWGEAHCMIPHIVYLANTSGLKVGITRHTQIPTRWIDQGASQALPILTVENRYQAGLLEVLLAKAIPDKTNWRKMLQGNIEVIDLLQEKENLLKKLSQDNVESTKHKTISLCEGEPLVFHYPVLEYPSKIVSYGADKTPEITGTLLGIKGQYLLLDTGVLNVRNVSGHKVTIEVSV